MTWFPACACAGVPTAARLPRPESVASWRTPNFHHVGMQCHTGCTTPTSCSTRMAHSTALHHTSWHRHTAQSWRHTDAPGAASAGGHFSCSQSHGQQRQEHVGAAPTRPKSCAASTSRAARQRIAGSSPKIISGPTLGDIVHTVPRRACARTLDYHISALCSCQMLHGSKSAPQIHRGNPADRTLCEGRHSQGNAPLMPLPNPQVNSRDTQGTASFAPASCMWHPG